MLSEQQLNSMSVEELEAYERQLMKDQNPQTLTDDELDSLTVEELEELEKKLIRQETKTVDNRYTDLWEYYGDRLQRGLTATPSMAYAAFQSVVNPYISEEKFPEWSTEGFEEGMKKFGENYMLAQNWIADTLGIDLGDMNKKAPNTLHKYAGTGVEFMADPFGALWKTGVKLTNLFSSESAKKLAGREATLMTMGTSSEIGGDVGAEFETDEIDPVTKFTFHFIFMDFGVSIYDIIPGNFTPGHPTLLGNINKTNAGFTIRFCHI